MRLRLLAPLFLALIITAHAAVPQSTYFVENEGQWQGDFRFRAAIPGGSAFVTHTGLVLDLQTRDKSRSFHVASSLAEGMQGVGGSGSLHFASSLNGGIQGGLDSPTRETESLKLRRIHGHVLRLSFLSANTCPDLRGQDKLSSYSNYFLGRNSSRWKSRVGHYPRILADDVWPGITVEYVLKPEGVELLYHIQAGAEPAAIQLQIEGLSSPLSLDAAGNLRLPTSLGTLTEHAPTAFQAGGAIPCRYRLTSDSTYTFTLDGYDPQQALTIDPLLYSTYFGDFNEDAGEDIAWDPRDGTVVLSGYTYSSEFPTTPGAYQDTIANAATSDLFVSRFAADAHNLLFSTYLGGGSYEWYSKLLLGADGTIWGAAETHSGGWPITSTAPDTTYSGGSEACFWHLSTDGTALLFSSFWGGSGYDYLNALDRDSLGQIYLAGRTSSPDFTITPNAIFPVYQGFEPAYVSVFDSTGQHLQASTFFPGQSPVYPTTLTVQTPLHVWIGGETSGGGLPVTADAFQPEPSERAGFFALLDLAASEVVYCSYLGGQGESFVRNIQVLDSNRLFLAGSTESPTFPCTPGVWDTLSPAYALHRKAFLMILDLPATIVRATFFGTRSGLGSTNTHLQAAQVMPGRGSVVICGVHAGPGYPATPDAIDSVGDYYFGDAFWAVLSPNMDSLEYSTLMGSAVDMGTETEDNFTNFALDSRGTIWLGGYTHCSDFPVTADAFQPDIHGWFFDAVLCRFSLPWIDAAADPVILRPSAFSLSAYPNPFNSTSTLRFTLPATSEVTLTLYDLLGREVLRKDLGRLSGGEHRRQLPGDGLSSGVYFARINAGPQSAVKKICLLR